ncbi:glycosyltransferase [Polaromonas sp.]|uniref:glycosyltransferase n=1 Tax=Polaromonas sp. TaxID=1869339 RepID=UPI003264230A
MKISIHTLGTRGDVQPYVALALGLKAAGHEVLMAAPAQFRHFVQNHGVGFAELPAGFLQLLEDPAFKSAMAKGLGILSIRKLLKQAKPMMAGLLDAEWAAASQFRPDVVVHHPKALGAPRIAAHLGVSAVLASPLPGFTPTSDFPTPLLPFTNLGPFNRLSHLLTARSSTLLFGGVLRSWEQATWGPGPAPTHAGKTATLYAYSPAVVPVPSEWGDDVLVSGYWFLDDAPWEPPAALAAFLAAGPPPVYVGFGSMPIPDPALMAGIVAEALGKTGQRAVLPSAWGGPAAGRLPDSVYLLDSAPHDRLFPLMGAVVHHGGAGTTAAALRAGKPMVICPFFGDQPFWGHRVAALGAGPAPLAARRLSADSLARALHEVKNPDMRAKAQDLSAKIRKERGVEEAVAFIERQAMLTCIRQ